MYNFFLGSEVLGDSTGILVPKLKDFQPAFERHAAKEESTAWALSNWANKLNLDFFNLAKQKFLEGVTLFQKNAQNFNHAGNHSRFLDSAVHFQYAALYIALIRAEAQKGKKDLEAIDKVLEESLVQLQKILTQHDTTSHYSTKHGAFQIIRFVINLLSENNPLNNKIYGYFNSPANAQSKHLSIPNLIQSICRKSISTQATLYKPQVYLRDLLEAELMQFKPHFSDAIYKRLPHQLTAYYLNLMIIAATINDGRTHFLGLDRISWDAYLSSICVEIAEFFSLKNTQGRASPLTISGAFAINKEQAVAFFKDSLQYQPLLEQRATSPFAPISAPQSIPSQVQRSPSSASFMPVQASAATPPAQPTPSPIPQSPPPDISKKVKVLYPYEKAETDEISCVADEVVFLVNPEKDWNKIGESEWVMVEKENEERTSGLFPANYLKNLPQ